MRQITIIWLSHKAEIVTAIAIDSVCMQSVFGRKSFSSAITAFTIIDVAGEVYKIEDQQIRSWR